MTLQDAGVIVTVLGSLATVLATMVGARRAGMRNNLKEVTGERDTLAANTRSMRTEHERDIRSAESRFDRIIARLYKIIAASRRYIASLESRLSQEQLDEIVRPAELDWDLDDGS